jgi:hypothetical protein
MAKKKSAVKSAKASKPAKKAVKKAAGKEPASKTDPKAQHKLKAIGKGLYISISGPPGTGKTRVGSMLTEVLQQLGYDVKTKESGSNGDIIHCTTPMVSIAALGNWDKSKSLPAFVETMMLGDTK